MKRVPSLLLLIILFINLLPAGATQAASLPPENPEIVVDTHPPADISVNEIHPAGDKLFINAYDEQHGAELWVANADLSSLTLVKDILPGLGDSYPYNMVNVNGVLFFDALTPELGTELWKSDGTPDGTVLVKDICPGTCSSYAGGMLVVHSGTSARLFFSAATTGTGAELWVSDGTPDGTYMIKDINPGPASGYPADLTVMQGKIYFSANDGASGKELWVTDGTEAGTTRVKDIRTGSEGSDLKNLRLVAKTSTSFEIFFSANDGTNGAELWKTDGTEAGTLMVKNINSDAASSNPDSLSVLRVGPSTPADSGARLIFAAADADYGSELWISDGTDAGTTRIKDICAGTCGASIQYMKAIGNKVYFNASTADSGGEVWVSDGTSTGTRLVKDITVGPLGSYPEGFTYLGSNQILFVANTRSTGSELWITDGTEANTRLLKDIYSGVANSNVWELTYFQGKILFIAHQGNDLDSLGTRYELFASDGTEAGTQKVAFTQSVESGIFPEDLAAFNGRVLFSAADEHGREPWISDGTPSGTYMLKDIMPGEESSNPSRFYAWGSQAFFIAYTIEAGYALWATDGTTQGTRLVKNLFPDSLVKYSGYIDKFTPGGAFLYFRCGNHLCKTDGTESGTGIVKASSNVYNDKMKDFAYLNGRILLSAAFNGDDIELWVSDGTETGTVQLKDIAPYDTGSSPSSFLVAGNTLYFAANDGVTGVELWKTDGTPEGTVLVKDIVPDSGSSSPRLIFASGSLVFFMASDGINGTELWKSDGTAEGTVLVKDMAPGDSSDVRSVACLTGCSTAYLSVYKEPQGYELWRTDGTSAGTTLVKAIWPNSMHSDLFNLTVRNNLLYFCASDPTLGYEVWRSDGTPAGTTPVTAFAAGPNDPWMLYELINVGGWMALSANDSTHGVELWRMNGITQIFLPSVGR